MAAHGSCRDGRPTMLRSIGIAALRESDRRPAVAELKARDYANSGLKIQYAMMDHFARFPNIRTRPQCILWAGRAINTASKLNVPKDGVVRGEFVRACDDVAQGFDVSAKGWIEMSDGMRTRRLRTWHHPLLPMVVEHRYHASDAVLWIWNIYKVTYARRQVVEEKWTGNAGFWVEEVSPLERIYHCSHGGANPPDFESLVFRITVRPTERFSGIARSGGKRRGR
jgi:hypothetical protein